MHPNKPIWSLTNTYKNSRLVSPFSNLAGVLLCSDSKKKKARGESQHLPAEHSRLFPPEGASHQLQRHTKEAPLNYVAGIGRGANGFTTRSDIGPARIPTAPDPVAAAAIAKRKAEDGDNADYSEANYDEFEGYGGSFVDPNAIYDAEDKEADDVWESIDRTLDQRRKARREERMRQELQQLRQERPTIQSQFADLKGDLQQVSYSDWDAIPEIGDTTQRFRKKVKTNMAFIPAPDSLLEQARKENEQYNTVPNSLGGTETPMSGLATPTTDLTRIGAGRKQIIGINLARLQDSVSGQTNVDPKGYLTDLSTIKINSSAEIGDIKKARLLLNSIRQTNPKHAPAWIGSARLESEVGKIVQARKIIMEGCDICPESQDIWLEAARLHTPENAKVILAKAIQHLPKATKIWLLAADLETDVKGRKKVLRKSLEANPNSALLWKAAIELETPEDAKILLGRAVECIPKSVEMWLALAHLETPENARKVLNRARLAVPTDSSIWITAAKLEESQGNEKIDMIVKRALKTLTNNAVVIERDQWMKEAENAEKSGAPKTCRAIIKEVIGLNVEEEDRKRVWIEDAEGALSREAVETARAIYEHALSIFPGKKSLYLRVAHLEKVHGTRESLENVLSKAVKHCPQAEILWLMAAKEKWMNGDVDGARIVLSEAFKANQESEQIWLAAVKLENENKELDRARALLAKARQQLQSSAGEKVWLKSAQLERQTGNTEEEKNLLEEALKKYPQNPKFWMMRGQLEERRNEMDTARELYQRGLKNCMNSIPLWICAGKLEQRTSNSRARTLYEKARLKNPKNADLWLAAIRVEVADNNPKASQMTLSKALQECPTSGILWAEAIDLEKPKQRRAKSVDALKRCDNDPFVIVAVAKVFWADRKYEKTRTWFNRAVTLNPDLGDAWAYFYKFEIQHGTEEHQQELLKRCVAADPRHGENWVRVSKDIANSDLKTEGILTRVANNLPNPLNQ
ncbi:hypothetical protein PROFUN_08266 [Planoprotostelium fungivorum]|uniref:PRP1 splicing factor N-terminal domain-containing protein n=1 Tax=Planoprotostelium fungivorum TaxID=1890364 RepID=A0A2P6NJY6_9EUKA|nr:hypothetical protein PROFUN_08266 [Planoprotostelium fungivorum]